MYALTLFPAFCLVGLALSGRKISRGVFFLYCIMSLMAFEIAYGFRNYGAGTDSYTYALAYESGEFRRWEPGYVLLLSLLRCLSDSYEFYFRSETFLKLSILVWSAVNVARISGYVAGAIFLALIFYSFTLFDLYNNGLRQGFAMTLATLSFSFYWRGNRSLALILAFLSPFFHLSYVIYVLIFLVALCVNNLIAVRYVFVAASALVALLLFSGFSFLGVFDVYGGQLIVAAGLEKNMAVYADSIVGSFGQYNIVGRLKLALTFSAVLGVCMLLSGSSDSRVGVVVIMVSALLMFYSVFAYQAYSYRYLYLAWALVPFVIVGTMDWFKDHNKTGFVYRSALIVLTAAIVLNYSYFVVLRGGLHSFEYHIF